MGRARRAGHDGRRGTARRRSHRLPVPRLHVRRPHHQLPAEPLEQRRAALRRRRSLTRRAAHTRDPRPHARPHLQVLIGAAQYRHRRTRPRAAEGLRRGPHRIPHPPAKRRTGRPADRLARPRQDRHQLSADGAARRAEPDLPQRMALRGSARGPRAAGRTTVHPLHDQPASPEGARTSRRATSHYRGYLQRP